MNSYLKSVSSFHVILLPVQASIPGVIASLSRDIISQGCSGHSAALPLLALLIRADKQGLVVQQLLQRVDVILALLNLFQSVDVGLLEATPAAEEQRRSVQQLLTLLLMLASSRNGAMALLSMSVFGALTHSPLLLTLRDSYQALTLTTQQKDALRRILHQFLQLALRLHESVESIRSVHAELASFVQALIPLSSLIFKDREGDQILAMDILGLYLGVLVVLADQREQFSRSLHGYEAVLKTEVISLLNYISKQETCSFICHQIRSGSKLSTEVLRDSRQNAMNLIAVENGMLFMSKMGWKIGDEYVRAFGVKE